MPVKISGVTLHSNSLKRTREGEILIVAPQWPQSGFAQLVADSSKKSRGRKWREVRVSRVSESRRKWLPMYKLRGSDSLSRQEKPNHLLGKQARRVAQRSSSPATWLDGRLFVEVTPWHQKTLCFSRMTGQPQVTQSRKSGSGKLLAVSNGANQGHSNYLILRSPVEQKRAVPKKVVWYGLRRLHHSGMSSHAITT